MSMYPYIVVVQCILKYYFIVFNCRYKKSASHTWSEESCLVNA